MGAAGLGWGGLLKFLESAYVVANTYCGQGGGV